MSTANANIVGSRIQTLRLQRRMTVEELAGAMPGEVAANTKLIESLEAGRLVPSLTPLLQIARALGVRLGSFLDDQAGSPLVLTRAGGQSRSARFVGSNLGTDGMELTFHSLAANKNDRNMEPFIIDVEPHSGEVVLSNHEGEEFIYVLDGGVELVYGREIYQLAAGDSIYYDSIVPHHLHAGAAGRARILAVVYAPA